MELQILDNGGYIGVEGYFPVPPMLMWWNGWELNFSSTLLWNPLLQLMIGLVYT